METMAHTTNLLPLRMLSSLLGGAAVLALTLSFPVSALAQDPQSAGAVISAKATAKDVGLPIYPGAKPHKDNDNDGDWDALTMGLWGGSFGFKIVLLKLESPDPPDKITTFYAAALAKYGKVLNCSGPSQAQTGNDKSDSSKDLTCDDDRKTGDGEKVFKAGTKARQHIVSVRPNGIGSVFDLVFLQAHD